MRGECANGRALGAVPPVRDFDGVAAGLLGRLRSETEKEDRDAAGWTRL